MCEPVVADLRRTAAGPQRPLGLRVEQVTDPNAPPVRRGKWQVVGADGVHLATCSTRASAKRIAANIEALHKIGAKLVTR